MPKFARWLDVINNISTVNIRVFVTLLCVIITTISYTFGVYDWQPSWEWLAFLATMSGLDAMQYTSKRMTYKPDVDMMKHGVHQEVKSSEDAEAMEK